MKLIRTTVPYLDQNNGYRTTVPSSLESLGGQEDGLAQLAKRSFGRRNLQDMEGEFHVFEEAQVNAGAVNDLPLQDIPCRRKFIIYFGTFRLR